jgi:hypothetical protein
MMAVTIRSTRPFTQAFFQCIGRHPISLCIVSPYLGDLPGYKTIPNFARALLKEEGTSFQLVTRPPERRTGMPVEEGCLTRTLAEQLVQLGVDLWVRDEPLLHSKVYQFVFREGDRVSFVGSANFSKGGFEQNDETMAMFREPAHNDAVRAELDRLCGRGSQPYHQWRARNSRL